MNAASIKEYLRQTCGYPSDFLETDYEFVKGKTLALAAFAHRPFDARSACIAALDYSGNDPREAALEQREFGAPVIFTAWREQLQVWKPGPLGADLVEPALTANQLPAFFEEYKRDLAPGRLYEAKTTGRLPGSRAALPRWVNNLLLPFAEGRMEELLVPTVEQVLGDLIAAAMKTGIPEGKRREEWALRATFRLLASKILQDKRVPRFINTDLLNVKDALARVQDHYDSTESVSLQSNAAGRAAVQAAKLFSELGSLRNLTTETLAAVYEEALITKAQRKAQGIHRTPSYLVDYIIWRLAPWIEKIGPERFSAFEPACGHAPFLVGLMRLVRTFDWFNEPDKLGPFLRQRMRGIDLDPFALEIAKLSLTIADAPRRNGWSQLKSADMFQNRALENMTDQCRVLISNPPFENGKAVELVRRAISHLPKGSVFGLVSPAAMLAGSMHKVPEVRDWIPRECQLAEVSLFADKGFRHADHEYTIVLGRRPHRLMGVSLVTARRVREGGAEGFAERYEVSTERAIPQSDFRLARHKALWIPEFTDEIWNWLAKCDKLKTVARIGQGLTHKSARELKAAGIVAQSAEPLPGLVLGFVGAKGAPMIHELPSHQQYMNLSPEAVARPRSGVDIGLPQVLISYAPVGRSIWKLKAFIDEKGHPISSRFITIRPTTKGYTLQCLWALLNSPVAQAYVHTHSLKREILVGTLRLMPVPKLSASASSRITRLVNEYCEAARTFHAHRGDDQDTLFTNPPRSAVPTRAQLHASLRRIDAETLRLYNLPARAEKLLLDQFAELVRPGVPGRFRGYFPKGFAREAPLIAFLTSTYIGGPPAKKFTESALHRYEELLEREARGIAAVDERGELEGLQIEMMAREYEAGSPDNSWLESVERRQAEARRLLAQIASEASE